jgi:hypothetical protein
MEEAPNKRNEVAILTDHVLVHILCCLTDRSLLLQVCCRSWNYLILDTEYPRSCPRLSSDSFIVARKAMPHHQPHRWTPLLVLLVRLALPSRECLDICMCLHRALSLENLIVSYCYTGLILYWCIGFCYVVCNLTTKKWLIMHDSICVLLVRLTWGLIRQSPHTSMRLNMSRMMVSPYVIRYPRPTWSLYINRLHYIPYVPLLLETLAEY